MESERDGSSWPDEFTSVPMVEMLELQEDLKRIAASKPTHVCIVWCDDNGERQTCYPQQPVPTDDSRIVMVWVNVATEGQATEIARSYFERNCSLTTP